MTDTDSSNIYNTDNYKEKFKKFQYKQFTKLFIELINEFLVHLSDKILLQNKTVALNAVRKRIVFARR